MFAVCLQQLQNKNIPFSRQACGEEGEGLGMRFTRGEGPGDEVSEAHNS